MISSAALFAAMVLAGPDQNDTNELIRQPAVASVAGGRGPRGVIVAYRDVQVPAEVAGKISIMKIREGAVLKPSQEFAHIDDREANARLKVAEGELAVAKSQERAAPLKKSEALFTLQVADSEHKSSLAMNKEVPDTVSIYEVRRQKLTRDRADVQVKTSVEDLAQATATVSTKQAQVDALKHEIGRHKITGPAEGGVVVELLKKKGEWVRQGDPVARVIQMKTLKVQVFVRLDQYQPSQIDGRQINFTVGNRKFAGKVTFINPIVESSGEYKVSALITNVRTGSGYWVLRPGMNVAIDVR